MSESLRLLLTKEQPWAIYTGRSWQKSDLSKSLKIEWFARHLKFSPLFMLKSKSLLFFFAQSIFFKEQPWVSHSGCSEQKIDPERFTPVALYKRATVSDSLRSLMTKEWQDRFALFHERIALLLTKNEQIAQKPNERIPNPGKQCTLLFGFLQKSSKQSPKARVKFPRE